MNIHPIFVHFPVALLTIYALMELIRWRKLTGQPYWFYVKALFLMLGGLGSLAAVETGELAVKFIQDDESLRLVLQAHEKLAKLSVVIFGVLSIGYLILWLNRENVIGRILTAVKIAPGGFVEKVWAVLVKLARFLTETRLVILLALAGLAAITITGGLGGIMVYGPNADPFFGLIYKLLFP